MRRRIPIIDRLTSKIRAVESGCWEWQASLGGHGYGQIHDPDQQKPRLAHRVVYEACYGPIPEGLTLDHLCRNPRCVNPAHLEPVTQRENWLRGTHWSAISERTGKCRRGHADWYVRPNGRRVCKVCRRQTETRRKQLREVASG